MLTGRNAIGAATRWKFWSKMSIRPCAKFAASSSGPVAVWIIVRPV